MDRFERIDKLGEGGQGKVYKVRKKASGEEVVLKMINCSDPTFATLAEREIEVMKACDHPHIINFEESFRHNGKSGNWVCLVMQYCAGGDLFTKFKNAVQEKRKFSEQQIISWICQIASGLHYMHERDLWHRDIKAANILFDGEGVVKLGDFGLSSTYSSDGHKTVVGTPFYFAPEIMLNQQYSNKVDIWNLGVVMLELLTFRQIPVNVEVLRNDRMQQQIMASIEKEGYSKKLALIIASMLGRGPDDRPSAKEILQQLDEGTSVMEGHERDFKNREDALREALLKHPHFGKTAKKAQESSRQKGTSSGATASSNAVKAKTPPNHSASQSNHTNPSRGSSGLPRAETPKRMTMAEGEIQKTLHEGGTHAPPPPAQHHDPNRAALPQHGHHPQHTPNPGSGNVTYLANQYERLSGRDRASPPQSGAATAATAPAPAFWNNNPTATSGPSSSNQPAGSPVHAHYAAKAATTSGKSPTSPLAASPHHHQHAHTQRRGTGNQWVVHPRSPVANETSGGSGQHSGSAGSQHVHVAQGAWDTSGQELHRHYPAGSPKHYGDRQRFPLHHPMNNQEATNTSNNVGSASHQRPNVGRGLAESDMAHVADRLRQLHHLDQGR
eukprot:TRINITY_DN18718_c0_g1_i1.p1 TRINITY_DN18718_c0_g1~~TRINITY_DN18718_c0_g1_i1.p1  ORF type:complete len:661 (+),score=220.81 TRINITY_DN18718_c0_g1_i1:147-1985(+)